MPFNQNMIVSTILKQVQCKLTNCFLYDGNIGLKLMFAAKAINFPGDHHTPLQESRKILTFLKSQQLSINDYQGNVYGVFHLGIVSPKLDF